MLRSERGDALIDGLLMLGVVVLVVLVAVQALMYAHARSVAQAAAQDGARAAAVSGAGAGVTRAGAVLAAGLHQRSAISPDGPCHPGNDGRGIRGPHV